MGKSGPLGMGCTRPCCRDEYDWTSCLLGMRAQPRPLLRNTSQHCSQCRLFALWNSDRCLVCTHSSLQILQSARMCPGRRPCSSPLQQRYLKATNRRRGAVQQRTTAVSVSSMRMLCLQCDASTYFRVGQADVPGGQETTTSVVTLRLKVTFCTKVTF